MFRWALAFLLLCFHDIAITVAVPVVPEEPNMRRASIIFGEETRPPCDRCQVSFEYHYKTWNDYYTIHPSLTASFTSSISSSYLATTTSGKSYLGLTIQYVTETPTTTIVINPSSTITLTCCEPYAIGIIGFDYHVAVITTRIFTMMDVKETEVFTWNVTDCIPTTTYAVRDSVVVWSSSSSVISGVDGEEAMRKEVVPSNDCQTIGHGFATGPVTKTVVAYLVEETGSAVTAIMTGVGETEKEVGDGEESSSRNNASVTSTIAASSTSIYYWWWGWWRDNDA